MFVLAAPCCFTGFLGLTEPFTLIIRNTLCKLPKKNVNYWWVWYTGLSGLQHLHVLNIYFVIQSPLVWSLYIDFPPGNIGHHIVTSSVWRRKCGDKRCLCYLDVLTVAEECIHETWSISLSRVTWSPDSIRTKWLVSACVAPGVCLSSLHPKSPLTWKDAPSSNEVHINPDCCRSLCKHICTHTENYLSCCCQVGSKIKQSKLIDEKNESLIDFRFLHSLH